MWHHTLSSRGEAALAVALVSSDESASVEEAPAKNSRKYISIWKGDGVQIFVSTRHRQFKDEKLTKLGSFWSS
jgi:hypothetical protein